MLGLETLTSAFFHGTLGPMYLPLGWGATSYLLFHISYLIGSVCLSTSARTSLGYMEYPPAKPFLPSPASLLCQHPRAAEWVGEDGKFDFLEYIDLMPPKWLSFPSFPGNGHH